VPLSPGRRPQGSPARFSSSIRSQPNRVRLSCGLSRPQTQSRVRALNPVFDQWMVNGRRTNRSTRFPSVKSGESPDSLAHWPKAASTKQVVVERALALRPGGVNHIYESPLRAHRSLNKGSPVSRPVRGRGSFSMRSLVDRMTITPAIKYRYTQRGDTEWLTTFEACPSQREIGIRPWIGVNRK